MSIQDLTKLIKRATPHIEDCRTPDRQDIVRKTHGHLTLSEVVATLDALEFDAESFRWTMQEALRSGQAAAAQAEHDSINLIGGGGHGHECCGGHEHGHGDGHGHAEEAHGHGHGAPAEIDTAVHAMYRMAEGIRLFGVPPARAAPPRGGGEEPAAAAAEGWEEAMAAAKARGAELFKAKDMAAAASAYAEAIRATPKGQGDIHTLYSNRSAALLQVGETEAALAEARRCVEASPSWPKGRFREGCCLRELGCYREALAAFREGRKLEPANKDWEKEIDKVERLFVEEPEAQARQLVTLLLPELLRAWVRCLKCDAKEGGVLQLQVNGELANAGTPKWRLIREGKGQAKGNIRYAFCQKKSYLANLAANVQSGGTAQIAAADVAGQALKLADVSGFLFPAEGNEDMALIHIDVLVGPGKMGAILCRVPCPTDAREYVNLHKDPPPPKGPVDGVLNAQKASGFPKGLPHLIGFHVLGGDLNFPVVDLERDARGEL